MAVTIHVNGVSNSLAHKGCMGITKSTLPDVCKTPSPGGPIPIPYPIIVSLSSTLKKGTKTVKVDGKNSAAIKGSEYSRCNGDEPGTAGGIKSSTNMKEATWISYAFDVKLDGKNACRLSDKMMMNHGNTACLMGTLHKPVPNEEICDLNIDCEKKDPPYNDCQVAQLCMMVDEFNKIPNDKKDKIIPSPRGTKPYTDQLKQFKNSFKALVGANPVDEEKVKNQFYDPGEPNKNCAYEEWVKSGRPAKASGRGSGKFNPDHTHPASHSGSLSGISGMKWADARVNVTAGPAMRKYDNTKHTKMTASKCCGD